jgi:hypothetical protein
MRDSHFCSMVEECKVTVYNHYIENALGRWLIIAKANVISRIDLALQLDKIVCRSLNLHIMNKISIFFSD